MRPAVVDLILAGLHRPFIISPGSDDSEVRGKRFDAELEADLVVAFSGGAVADRGGAFFSCDVNQLLCDQRPGHRGAEQVFILVDSACKNARHDVIVAEFVDDVHNMEAGSAAGDGALTETVEFFFLAAVDAAADDVVVVIFL